MAAPGIAHRHRAAVLADRLLQHPVQFGEIGRRIDLHAWDGIQIGHVKYTVVGLSIVTHQTGTVHGKDHMQSVNGYIMKEHIVAALQEGGIDSKPRYCPLLGHARRHRDGTAFRDTYIEKPLRERFGEGHQPRSADHCRGHSTHPTICPGQAHQGASKNGGKILSPALERLSSLRIKGRNTMEGVGIGLSR